jgi:predicted acetyltransferase
VTVDVRAYDGEMRDYVVGAFTAFSEHIAEPDIEPWTRLLEPDRALAAYDGTGPGADRLVGTTAAISFDLTVPGASLPAAGVTIVGVHPTHRRRGILRRMMERQLDDVRERGEAIAVLWASDAGIYQRFGYGLASFHGAIKIDRQHNAFRRPHEPTGTLRLIGLDEARTAFPPVFDAARRERVGFFTRSTAYWDTWVFAYPDAWRHGRGDPFHVIHEVDGTVDGYVRYAIRSGERTELSVMDMVAATPAAHLDLWRYVLDVDLVNRVECWNSAVDDPLLLAVDQPRRLEMTIGDALWLRIVDVEAALAGRRYRGEGRVVLELSDAVLPSNAGRWALDVDGGVGALRRTDEAAEVALDTTDLAATYLGGVSFTRLAAARRVAEHTPGALERADRLFGTAVAPWVPSVF